jgi:hypothetical protein
LMLLPKQRRVSFQVCRRYGLSGSLAVIRAGQAFRSVLMNRKTVAGVRVQFSRDGVAVWTWRASPALPPLAIKPPLPGPAGRARFQVFHGFISLLQAVPLKRPSGRVCQLHVHL